jgi:hypothetical protein
VQPNVVVASNDDDQDNTDAATPKGGKLGAPDVPKVQKAQPDDQLNKALEVLKQKAA